jgi:hypothetical protein
MITAPLAGTGLSRPPRIVSTFSLWRSKAEMADYAYGSSPPAHTGALSTHAAKPFHAASTFVRFRPYASCGQWDGRDPLTQTSEMSGTTTGASIGV